VQNLGTSQVVFLITIGMTFMAAVIARLRSSREPQGDLAGRQLNRWLVGLSAGTTANSGFVVTAAVGLGYAYGVQWIMLPISWLLGDLIFWTLFPARINALGHESCATTISQLLTYRLAGRLSGVISVVAAVVIVICLAGYTSAQWLAGQKFLSGAFALPDYAALGLFALLIIAYSSIGGFRGSVYTDVLQAFIRIAGTVIALVAVSYFAMKQPSIFSQNIRAAGNNFLNPFPGGTFASVVGFVCGYAAAAIGFGLGQPQIVSRYLAGRSPTETRSAQWVYISFVQFTWIAMTAFGVLLRGVMPGIADAESGLSVFFSARCKRHRHRHHRRRHLRHDCIHIERAPCRHDAGSDARHHSTAFPQEIFEKQLHRRDDRYRCGHHDRFSHRSRHRRDVGAFLGVARGCRTRSRRDGQDHAMAAFHVFASSVDHRWPTCRYRVEVCGLRGVSQ
jgi:Na+/proline symporter